jgi:hypothetical protein
MTSSNFESLRSRRPDCPSNLALERYAAQELPAETAASIRQHLELCDVCPQRLKANDFAAMPEFDERLMLAAIRKGMDEPQGLRERAVQWLRGGRAGWLAFAAAVGTIVLLVLPQLRAPSPQDPDSQDTVRMKGAPVLHVYLRRGEKQEEVLSGSRFQAGDGVRFVVDLPTAGQVVIVGVEASGALYTAWPRAKEGGKTALPAGKAQALPGGMTLDESAGREMLYLVHCAGAATTPECQSRGSREPPACSPGCTLSTFVLDKSR